MTKLIELNGEQASFDVESELDFALSPDLEEEHKDLLDFKEKLGIVDTPIECSSPYHHVQRFLKYMEIHSLSSMD